MKACSLTCGSSKPAALRATRLPQTTLLAPLVGHLAPTAKDNRSHFSTLVKSPKVLSVIFMMLLKKILKSGVGFEPATLQSRN